MSLKPSQGTMNTPIHIDTPLEEIGKVYNRLKDRFHSGITTSLDYRIYNLKQLGYLLHDNEKRIELALKLDLDKGRQDMALSDLMATYNEIELAIRSTKKWMKDETQYKDALLAYKFMRPSVKKQPRGLALIISPWNFPWQCSLCPLVGAIAAGCPAIIKPSELAPTSSALLAELLPRYLDPEGYAVVLGGVEQSTKLLEYQWGHILFTGSNRVGKLVAAAGAKTLSPTTLELGGKSPVIVSSCADVRIAAARMFSIKQFSCGQMCVAPDYVLCAKDRVDDFVEACKDVLKTQYPSSPNPNAMIYSPSTSAMQNEAAFQRQVNILDKAEAEGKLVYRGEEDRQRRRMGFSVVKLNEDGKDESGPLVEEELFGPVLPVIPIRDIDAAIQYINSRPHPLALYVCSSKRSVFDKVVNETTSGSITWNDFVARTQPFGGVGDSGWGSYHGYDGFRTFTHFKTVIKVPLIFEPIMSLRYPPMSRLKENLFVYFLCMGVPYNRPVSVEDERRKRRRGEMISWVLWMIGITIVGYGLWVLIENKLA
ncbi:hypothetical protein M231_03347 [Tremella mesenterica]|uniref:Aldehyde dehydrogenase n=1 Tax=Tremella mesenterica TaxID=5217 RepID=A0A4Q1BNG2_TREME|nr:hypothetical protein M231_03347 [Tremella mesenterica]